MHLNLTHLATLEAVVRLGTMNAAATELGYTAGAVSQQMDALNRSVGTAVFERVGRHVVLTDAGRTVARLAPDLIAAERRLLDEVSNSPSTVNDRLVIGSWGSTAAALIEPIVSATRIAHPGVTVFSHEVDVDDASNSVHRRVVDVAFGLTYPDAPLRREPDVVVIPLRHERFGVAVAQGRRDLPRTVDLARLAGEEWILPRPTTQYGGAMLRACRRAGFEPRVRHQVSTDTAATLNLVSQGLGLAPATGSMLPLVQPRRIRLLKLNDDVGRNLVLLAPRDYHRRNALAALVTVIESAVREPARAK